MRRQTGVDDLGILMKIFDPTKDPPENLPHDTFWDDAIGYTVFELFEADTEGLVNEADVDTMRPLNLERCKKLTHMVASLMLRV